MQTCNCKSNMLISSLRENDHCFCVNVFTASCQITENSIFIYKHCPGGTMQLRVNCEYSAVSVQRTGQISNNTATVIRMCMLMMIIRNILVPKKTDIYCKNFFFNVVMVTALSLQLPVPRLSGFADSQAFYDGFDCLGYVRVGKQICFPRKTKLFPFYRK